MNNMESPQLRQYYEILVQNAQKGESYRIRFRGSNVVFRGIPLIHTNFDSPDDTLFMFRVAYPESNKGIHYYPLDDIDNLEKEE